MTRSPRSSTGTWGIPSPPPVEGQIEEYVDPNLVEDFAQELDATTKTWVSMGTRKPQPIAPNNSLTLWRRGRESRSHFQLLHVWDLQPRHIARAHGGTATPPRPRLPVSQRSWDESLEGNKGFSQVNGSLDGLRYHLHSLPSNTSSSSPIHKKQ